jgi:hypothetical protein
MFYEFKHPIPVSTKLGAGYVLYVRDGGTWENDIFAVALEKTGQLRHFRSDQLKISTNGTFDINSRKN